MNFESSPVLVDKAGKSLLLNYITTYQETNNQEKFFFFLGLLYHHQEIRNMLRTILHV